MNPSSERLAMLDKIPLKVEADDDVLCQTLDNEVVLLKLNSQQYFGLDEVGAYAWKLLAENGDIAAVAERLCGDFAGDPAAIRRDLHALVAELMEAGLLRAVHV
jgi:Coenzyme PQQ synthesis protein D (PqqD)